MLVGEERSLMKEKFPVKLDKVLLVDSAVLCVVLCGADHGVKAQRRELQTERRLKPPHMREHIWWLSSRNNSG